MILIQLIEFLVINNKKNESSDSYAWIQYSLNQNYLIRRYERAIAIIANRNIRKRETNHRLFFFNTIPVTNITKETKNTTTTM